MFKPSKKVAAALGMATIAGSAGLLALAPAANGATVTAKVNMSCTIAPAYGGDQTADFNFSIEVPEKTAPGSTANLTVTMGPTPVKAPLTVSMDIPFNVNFTGTASGGATGPLTITGVPGKIPGIVKNEPITLPTFDAAFPVPANATDDVVFDLTDMALTAVIGVPCTVNGPGTLVTVPVDVPSNPEPTLQSTPGEVKPGGAVTVTGANWPAGTPTVELCNASGAECDASKVAGALTVTDGALSGTATIAAGVADGAYQLKVTSGDKSATSNVSVKAETPTGERKVVATPNHGPVGTTTVVTGSGFSPNTPLYVVPANAAGEGDLDDLKQPTTDEAGEFSVEITVGKADTVLIAASEDIDGKLSAAADFTVDTVEPPAGTLKQDIGATIAAGALTITQESGSVALSDVTLNGTDQAMTGALNTVTVKDYRASGTGWTLTGAVTDFTNGSGGTIPAEKFSWTPAIAAEGEAPSVPVAGSAGPIGKAGATLASAPNAELTGGTFKADAALSLAVPAYQASGNYSGTLTLSIS